MSEAEFEDRYQDACCVAVRVERREGELRNLEGIMKRALKCRWKDELRRRGRHPTAPLDEDALDVAPYAGVALDPADEVELQESSRFALEVVGTVVNARRQQVLKLRHAFGLSVPEVCRLMGISERTYRKLHSAAAKELRSRLELLVQGRWCASRHELLVAYAAGTAGERQASEAREHIRNCPPCRRKLAALRRAHGARPLRSVAAGPPSAAASSSPRRSRAPAACGSGPAGLARAEEQAGLPAHGGEKTAAGDSPSERPLRPAALRMRDKPLTSFQIDDERLAGERFAAGRAGFELVPGRLRSGPRQLARARLLSLAGLAAAAVAVSQLGLSPDGSSKAADGRGRPIAVGGGARSSGARVGRAVPLVLGASPQRQARERGRLTRGRGGAIQRGLRRGSGRSGDSALRGSG